MVEFDGAEFEGLCLSVLDTVRAHPSYGYAVREQLLFALLSNFAPDWVMDSVGLMFDEGVVGG